MTKLLDFSSVEHFVYDILCLLRKHSFFRGGGGPEEFMGGGSLTFCLLKKGGST